MSERHFFCLDFFFSRSENVFFVKIMHHFADSHLLHICASESLFIAVAVGYCCLILWEWKLVFQNAHIIINANKKVNHRQLRGLSTVALHFLRAESKFAIELKCREENTFMKILEIALLSIIDCSYDQKSMLLGIFQNRP